MASLFFCAGLILGGCSNDDINALPMPEENYETTDVPVAFTVNHNQKASNSLIEFREELTSEFYLNLTDKSDSEVEAQFYFNVDLLDKYNEINGTKYPAFPEVSLELQDEGKVKVKTGERVSSPLKLRLMANETLDPSVTYVIPLGVKALSGNVKIGKSTNYLVFIRDLSKLPNADKESGIKIISCMEVNDTNPLNNLNYTLKSNGKPIVDIVVLFSGNINYNPETGEVFNHNNPNVQHLLDNKEHYLKPLQDRGMKVVLGILGNHDIAGVNNLAPETSKKFAQELKAVCESYNLDGIFWDDEYSKYPDGTPGFETRGASRLIYETKKAMPDKLNCVYAYGSTGYLSEIDGVQPGEYIDWAIDDYGGYASGTYPGITKKQWAVASQEFNRGYWASDSRLRQLRAEGYGGHMIFAMDPFRHTQWRQVQAMESIAEILFDDELVVDENFHKKDW
ncbi:MAG: BT_3987 domain-containing protein [Bacteroides sp.]